MVRFLSHCGSNLLAPSGAMESTSLGRLFLVERGADVWLYNSSTGEQKQIRTECRPCTLRFFPSGAAQLVYADGSTELASQLLSQRFCEQLGEDGEKHLFISRSDGSDPRWVSDILVRPSVVRAVAVAHGTAKLCTIQVYQFSCGVGAGCSKIWWALPMIIDWVTQADCAAEFLKRGGLNRARQACLDAGFLETEVRGSRRQTLSNRVGGIKNGEAVRMLQYITSSTRGTLCTALGWLSGACKSQHYALSGANCRLLVDRLCELAACRGGFMVSVGGKNIFFVAEGALVDLRGMATHGCELWVKRLFGRLQKEAVFDQAKLTDLMCDLWHMKRTPSRYAGAIEAGDWLMEAIQAVHLQLEVSEAEDWWTSARLLDLHKESPNKNRGLSEVYKREIVKTAREMPTHVSASSFLNAAAVFAGGVAPSEVTHSKDTARKAETDATLAYMTEGCRIFRHPRSIHLCHDEVRADGEDNDIYVAFLPQRDIAGIPPIQVPPRKHSNAFSGSNRNG